MNTSADLGNLVHWKVRPYLEDATELELVQLASQQANLASEQDVVARRIVPLQQVDG